MDINDLLTELESLTDEERAKIADRLLERLARPDSQLDAQWADLAHQRLSELRDDTVDGVPASEVLGRISHRFAQFADFVESRVAEGRSGSDSEVIRTGLRLLEESEARLQAIRQAVADGFSSGSPERFDVDEFIAEKTGNPARG